MKFRFNKKEELEHILPLLEKIKTTNKDQELKKISFLKKLKQELLRCQKQN